MLLPYLDQAPAYNLLNPGPFTLKDAFNDPAKLKILQTPMSIFLCPSDPEAEINRNRPFTIMIPNTNVLIAKSNYPASNGDSDNDGVFISANTSVLIRDITDGTSNTFMVGERKSPEGQWAAVWAGAELCCGPISNVWADVATTRFRMQDGVAGTDGGTVTNPAPAQAFGSPHEGGSHFLLCDGSARFVSENINWGWGAANKGTYNWLGQRNDNKVVGEF
jgi:hypothetical protein